MVPENLYTDCFSPRVTRVYKINGNISTRKYPLFPGYIFIVTDDPEKISKELYKIGDFTRILKNESYFEPIAEEEADFISALLNNEKNVDLSVGFIKGDRIVVTEGSLMGFEGRINHIDRHKREATVQLQLLGREIDVKLPLEIVSKSY